MHQVTKHHQPLPKSVIMSTATTCPELLILSVEVTGPIQDIGAVASKAMNASNRYRYSIPVVYTLEDGQRVESVIRGLTKPKLQERLASNQRYVDRRAMKAKYYDYEDIGAKGWSFITSISLR